MSTTSSHNLITLGLVSLFFALAPSRSHGSQIPITKFEPKTFSSSLSSNMQQAYYSEQYLLSDELSSRQGVALVVTVQKALAEREYYSGEIDGIVGLETETALFLFQMDLDLNITGSINSSTLEKLNITSPKWLSQ
ncbi:peptidoglycan-binding domain-containing protein [Pseudomonas tolaasii]